MKSTVVLFSLSLILCGYKSFSQVVFLHNKDTKEPIENVLAYNTSKSVSSISDSSGKMDLRSFSGNELITFRHQAYNQFTVLKSSIDSDRIYLSERITHIKSVIVSANKWEQDITEIPNQIVSISSDDVILNNPQTSADLLASTGEVFIQKSQLGGGSPKLRGFSANSILLVVDGVRMNNAIYRSGNLQNVISIDPNSVQGAEVIMGPSSVIYGSDAMGGVMDFHTKEARFSIDEKPRTLGSTFTRYSSASNEKATHLDFGIATKRFSSFTSLSYSDFDDLKAGGNRPVEYVDIGKRTFEVAQDASGNDIVVPSSDINLMSPSGFSSWNMVQKLGFKASEKLSFDYGLYFSNTSDIPRYDRLIQTENGGGPSNAVWFYGPQKWTMHRFKALLTSSGKVFDQAKIIIAHQDYKESRNDRKFGDDRLRTRSEKVKIWSTNIDFDKRFNKKDLFYGVELLHNDISSTGFRRNIFSADIESTAPRYPDGGSQYVSIASYVSYSGQLWENMRFNSGLRYSHVNIRAKTSDAQAGLLGSESLDLNNSALSGSFGLVHSKGLNKVSALFSTGFRAPNIDDVGKLFELDDNIVIVPNPNLKPEYSYNSEINWQHNASRFSIEATAFYTFLTDAIVRGNFEVNNSDTLLVDGNYRSIRSQINAEQARIYGFSLSGSYQFHNNFAVKAAIAATGGKELKSGEPLRHTTPPFGSVRAVYKKNKVRTEFYIDFSGRRARAQLPSTEIDDKPYLYARHLLTPGKDGSPAWATFNLKATYQVNKHLSITGGVENITDLHYRTYSSGISAPGRNFIIAVRGNL